MFTSDLTRRQRAWPGAACVALSARRRGLTRRLCDRGAAQPQRAAAGRAVGGRRVNASPASGRRFHDAKPQARRPGEERQVLDGAHGREPPVEAAPGRAPASLNTLSRAAAAARAAAGGVWRGGGVAPAAAPSPRTARDHTKPTHAAPPPRESPSNHTAVALVRRLVESARRSLDSPPRSLRRLDPGALRRRRGGRRRARPPQGQARQT